MAATDDKPAIRTVEDAKKLERLIADSINKGILACMQTKDGREFLWWLLQVGKEGTQPFTSNALVTAFNCGEMNVGKGILKRFLEVNPAIYVRMMQEHGENDGSSSGVGDPGRSPSIAADYNPLSGERD